MFDKGRRRRSSLIADASSHKAGRSCGDAGHVSMERIRKLDEEDAAACTWRGMPDGRFGVHHLLAASALPAATCHVANWNDGAGAEQLFDLLNGHVLEPPHSSSQPSSRASGTGSR